MVYYLHWITLTLPCLPSSRATMILVQVEHWRCLTLQNKAIELTWERMAQRLMLLLVAMVTHQYTRSLEGQHSMELGIQWYSGVTRRCSTYSLTALM